MGDVNFTSEQFTRTRERYRKTSKRRWTLIATDSACIVDIRYIVQFLQEQCGGRETRSMRGDTIVITSYNALAPEKTVTKFIPVGK
jgi:hypothetical protein